MAGEVERGEVGVPRRCDEPVDGARHRRRVGIERLKDFETKIAEPVGHGPGITLRIAERRRPLVGGIADDEGHLPGVGRPCEPHDGGQGDRGQSDH